VGSNVGAVRSLKSWLELAFGFSYVSNGRALAGSVRFDVP